MSPVSCLLPPDVCVLQVSEEEVSRLVTTSLQPLDHKLPDFSKFNFCPRTVQESDSGNEKRDLTSH